MAKKTGVAVRIQVIDDVSARLDAINRSIDKFMARPKAISNAISNLSEKAGVTKLAGAVGNAAEKTSVLGQRVGRLLGPLAMLGQAATIAGIVAIGHHFGETATAVGRAAAETGVASDRLQALQYAAKASGASAEAMTAGLADLSHVLRDASLGQNSEAVMGLNALGISLRDAQGNVRSTADVLPDLADRLKNIKDPAQAAFVATTFFGGAGRDLLPTLRQGADGIRNLTDEAARYGVVIGEDALRAGQQFALSSAKLSAVLTGLGNSIGAKIVPVLTPLIDKITAWVAANRELISTRVEQVVRKVSDALQRVDFDKVLAGMTSFVDGIGSAIDFLGGFENAGIAVLVFLNGPLIMAALSAGSALLKVGVAAVEVAAKLAGLATIEQIESFGKLGMAAKAAAVGQWAMNVALSANPIGLVVAGVAALAGAIYAVYANWGKITDWFNGKISSVVGAFRNGLLPGLFAVIKEFNPVTLMSDAVTGLIKWLTGIDLSTVGAGLMQSLIDGIKSMFPDLGGLTAKISGMFSFGGGDAASSGSSSPSGAPPVNLPQMVKPPPPSAAAGAAGGGVMRPSEANPARVEVTITARDMPPGTRVAATTSGPVTASVNVGYSGIGTEF